MADDFNIPIHSQHSAPVFRPRLTCEDVLQKCDDALNARKEQIKKLELGLTKQTERVADLMSQVQDKDEQLQSWYRNPFVVFSLGLVAGAAVITFAK